jgi:hypothetical protein
MGAPEGQAAPSLVFFIDNSIVVERCAAWTELRRLAATGAIELRIASALGDDLSHDRDLEQRARLEAEISSYPKMAGVFVIGESRLDDALLASEHDDTRFLQLFAAVFSETDRSSSSRTASNKRRDVMHLLALLKYGGNGFITRDKRVLKKAAVLRDTFGIVVLTPQAAIDLCTRGPAG